MEQLCEMDDRDVSGAAPSGGLSITLECNALGALGYFQALLVHSGTSRYLVAHG